MKRNLRAGVWLGAALVFAFTSSSLPAQDRLPGRTSDERPRASLGDPVPAEEPPTVETGDKTGDKTGEKTGDKAAAEKVKAPAEAATCDGCCGSFDWKNVPPIHVFPRPGFFGIPPKGPGYYSLLDCIHHELRPDRPKYGYTPAVLQTTPFFDIDWRYLEDPKTPPQDLLEHLHRVHIGDNWLFATGGEFRWRHAHEANSRLSGQTNEYDLMRTRVFADIWYKDRLRGFVEYVDADSFHGDLPPAITDIDRSDIFNAFIELKVWDDCNGKAYVRAGRQELLFGSQRLISPPDWLNTRRTFNGVRGYYQTKKWDFDLFWAQPVIPNKTKFDSVDNNQNFAGAWATYRPDKGQFRDFYYLFLDNTNNTTQQRIVRAPFNVHTVGTRWTGDKNHWLYEFEGMLQFGERGAADIFAGAATGGIGYHFECCPWSPVVWLNYDYASGDQNPNVGDYHTFNQLFAFGHYYMGWLDLVGRQNIHDFNAHLYLYPTKWITLDLQYHHFEAGVHKDALYNAAGVAIKRDATGASGRHVGDEIDIIANFHLSRRIDVLAGYSFMWRGNFLENTAPGSNPSLLYVMFNYRW